MWILRRSAFDVQRSARCAQVPSDFGQLCLELSTHDVVDAELAHQVNVQRCIQAIGADAADGFSDRTRAISGAASRVAVCIGR